jgi:hypothetical protein
VDPDLFEEIIIVENGPPNLPDGWRHLLLREYGALRDKVKFVPASTLSKINPHPGGWFTQQILKLTVSKIVKTKYYLILDAKNHFIFPFTRQHIEADGKPKMFVHGYQKHPLRRYLDPILRYFKLADHNVHRMLPTTPPFYAHTGLVREMIQAMVAREKRGFEELFCRSGIRFTEFFMISSYILTTGRRFEDYYDLSDGGYSIIWKYCAADDAAVEREINNSEKRKAPFFSVHRGSFPLLSEKSRKNIAAFWLRRGLFTNEADALRYLANPNKR